MPTPANALKELSIAPPGFEVSEPEPSFDWNKSPNFSSRNGQKIDTIVLHCTAGSSTAGALSRLLDASADASSHIVIPDNTRNGEPKRTVRLVEDDKAAWHVRPTILFDGKKGMNSRSLGIEIVNSALAGDTYSDWQVEETARWCRYWMGRHPIKYLVTHAYLDPERRRDPCDTFPWNKFLELINKSTKIEVSQPNIKFNILGNTIDIDAEIQENTLWAPVRPVVEALGFKISFDPATQTTTISKL